jgi:hypothetical protein
MSAKQAGVLLWTSDVRIDVFTAHGVGDMVRITTHGREVGFALDKAVQLARRNDFARNSENRRKRNDTRIKQG